MHFIQQYQGLLVKTATYMTCHIISFKEPESAFAL